MSSLNSHSYFHILSSPVVLSSTSHFLTITIPLTLGVTSPSLLILLTFVVHITRNFTTNLFSSHHYPSSVCFRLLLTLPLTFSFPSALVLSINFVLPHHSSLYSLTLLSPTSLILAYIFSYPIKPHSCLPHLLSLHPSPVSLSTTPLYPSPSPFPFFNLSVTLFLPYYFSFCLSPLPSPLLPTLFLSYVYPSTLHYTPHPCPLNQYSHYP